MAKFVPRYLAAIVTVALLACSVGLSAGESNVITLTLEDAKDTPKAEQPADGVPDLSPPCPAVRIPPPEIKAASAVLMDADSGQVIWSRNPHVRRPNASTTKILTAILLIEHCKMTDTIKASKKACETPFTSLHMKPGEKISAYDLLMGMMVRSANDAAVAVAEHITGSTPKFAAMMNKKAREIGCRNTRFVTPNGLHDSKHYSTAHDLCLMARYAFRYPVFNEAAATVKHTLSSRSANREDLVVFTRSKFLKEYPGADGVKSGYLKQAGYCLVGSATRDGWRLVSAVLRSDNAGRDTTALMDYGFTNFEPVTVARQGEICAQAPVEGGDRDVVAAAPARDLRVVVPKSGARVDTRLDLVDLKAPIGIGARVGTMTACVNGADAAKVELRAAEAVGLSFARRAEPWLKTGALTACLLVGGRYGVAFTKNTRRRRRRLPAALRGVDSRR